ncbi:MAG TPA: type IV pilus modification protein PilV [Nevskiales bacterium]|nr:type IV pilus modification protein PilV [Nevskiales bacterium]
MSAGNIVRRGQLTGFSLIEVLVTLVILSIGLLSLAALQIATLKNNNSALSRFEATTLAYEILDRMRANRTPALNGAYNIALSAGAPTACATIASCDLRDWLSALDSNLPAGDGAIVVNGRVATVTVQWLERWDQDLAASESNRFMTLVFRTEL